MNLFATVIGLLGVATTVTFVLGLWVPAYVRHLAIRRRLAGFVHAGTRGGFAVDLGGWRRARALLRPKRDRTQLLARHIEEKILQAQAEVTVGEVLAAMAGLALAALAAAALLSGSLLAGLVAALLAGSLPLLWLSWLRARLLSRFSAQLVDTVALLASSVRSGHSLLQALEHLVTEAPDPTRSAFALVVREIGLGASQDQALERLVGRLPSEDLELIVSAINVHQHIGGSLAKILDSIGDMIRERLRIKADIAGLTAQQRFSAYVLCALPVFAALSLFLISPDYIAVMFESPALRTALITSAALVLAGFVVMRRLASIDV